MRSPPPTLLFLLVCRLPCPSPFSIPTPVPAELRGEGAGPGLLGGFADVAIKLLHGKFDEPIDEQDEVVEAAQCMLLPLVNACSDPAIIE